MLTRLRDRRSAKRPPTVTAEERIVWAINRVLESLARLGRYPDDSLERASALARHHELVALRHEYEAHTLSCRLIPSNPQVGRPPKQRRQRRG